MSQKIYWLKNETGGDIAYRYYQTRPNPRGAVLICQSLKENFGNCDSFCRYLAEENLVVYVCDYHNDKKTTENISPHFLDQQPKDVATIVEDTIKLRALISTRYEKIPVILFGYSFGTIIALSALIHSPHEFSGIALWNLDLQFGKYTNILTTFILKVEKFLKGSDTSSRFMRYMTYDLWLRDYHNWKNFLRDPKQNSKTPKSLATHPSHGFNMPISMWIELMSAAININSKGYLNLLPKKTAFYLLSGGSPALDTEESSQMQNLAKRLYQEEFYNMSLMTFPPIPPHQLKDQWPPETIKALRNWIVNSHLPKAINLIEHHNTKD
ncbi:alpha/beta hydrolase [Candidatus Liberibacter sp.]|uniref:alpha/beta hydrolase n=1 Tax=Candidatus Liberibacter sp. TaxID=34022 RepID=UPI0015F40978|nr:alpha/beta hydrolase [Candidatus Liberibacter sp.]MBA5723889.1 alpha/beta hydrolase [Candidatus Liberibacter sp.]